MKALITITGRGIGGDTVTALNIAKSLEKEALNVNMHLTIKLQGSYFEK